MNTQKIKRASAGHIRKGSGNHFDGLSKGLSVSDITEKREELQLNLLAVMKPAKKVVKLYRCFGCQKNFALPKMSSCLVLCRGCHTAARDKGKHAKNNFTAKTLNAIHGFLRRTLQNA
ncbi:MAG: hypothetical protein WKF90_12130 [Pyrinomonadaceae bacterium]